MRRKLCWSKVLAPLGLKTLLTRANIAEVDAKLFWLHEFPCQLPQSVWISYHSRTFLHIYKNGHIKLNLIFCNSLQFHSLPNVSIYKMQILSDRIITLYEGHVPYISY